jgi:hypothetical protein
MEFKKPIKINSGEKLVNEYWKAEYQDGRIRRFKERPASSKDMKCSPILVREFRK